VYKCVTRVVQCVQIGIANVEVHVAVAVEGQSRLWRVQALL
jgi:hypothetical protein